MPDIDPNMPDPWADLDALLTAAGIGTAAPDAEPAAPVMTTAEPAPLPATAPPPLAPQAPQVEDIDAPQRRALTGKALQAAHNAVDVIAETFAAKGADFDDAVKALPHLHRVLEHVEKLEAARKTATTMPTAVLTIVLDGTPQVAPPRKRRPTPEVIDIVTD